MTRRRDNDNQSILNLKIIFSKHFHFYVHYLILDDNDNNEEMKMTKFFGVKHDEEAQVNGHTCIFVLYYIFLHCIVNTYSIYIFFATSFSIVQFFLSRQGWPLGLSSVQNPLQFFRFFDFFCEQSTPHFLVQSFSQGGLFDIGLHIHL